MKHYFAAQIRINDPAEYKKYLEKVDETFSAYNGKYLAVDESPAVIEGEWKYTKSVLIEFNSKKEFEDWYYSSEYQTILKFRLKAAICDSILLEGLD